MSAWLGDNLMDLGYLPCVGKDFIAIRPPLTLTAEQGGAFVDAGGVVSKGEVGARYVFTCFGKLRGVLSPTALLVCP